MQISSDRGGTPHPDPSATVSPAVGEEEGRRDGRREEDERSMKKTEGGETKLEIIFITKNPALVFAI